MKTKTIRYFIKTLHQPEAGIVGVTEEITISIDSGDAGGESGEFEEHMLQALKEWYDGAKIVLEKKDD